MPDLSWYQRRLKEFNKQHKYHYAVPISKRLHKAKYTCTSCGDLIPTDEVCSPSLDGESFICDDCYNDLYRFFCPICEDLDEEKECDDIGCLIILTDQEKEGIVPGAYEIIKFPYSVFGEPAMYNIKRVGDYTPKHPFIYDDCFMGTVKICRACQEAILVNL